MKFGSCDKLVFAAVFLLCSLSMAGKGLPWFSSNETWMPISEIDRAIHKLQPGISSVKRQDYASAISIASRKFGIHPMTLVAIAHQESSFRANIAEGPAGEIGLCQVLKRWVRHPKFVKQFGFWTKQDLRIPLNNFMASAWILADLKQSPSNHGVIPYWSYYNARRFDKRMVYFKRVSRQLGKLVNAGFNIPVYKRNVHYSQKNRMLAAWKPKKLKQNRKPSSSSQKFWTPPTLPTVKGGWIEHATKKLHLESLQVSK